MTPETHETSLTEEMLPTEISEPRPLLRIGVTILAALIAVFLLYTAHAFLTQERIATAGCAASICD